MIDEGVIKFSFSRIKNSFEFHHFEKINETRTILHKKELIGEYPIEKLGYGNISMKSPSGGFYISASQTGAKKVLEKSDYVEVHDYSFKDNSLTFSGEMKPSSESLTHASIYSISDSINAVIHIHHNELWKKMITHHAPSTDEKIQYGTIEMAEQVKMISEGKTNFYFVMKGHEDGIIIFAESMKLALDHTLELYHRYLS